MITECYGNLFQRTPFFKNWMLSRFTRQHSTGPGIKKKFYSALTRSCLLYAWAIPEVTCLVEEDQVLYNKTTGYFFSIIIRAHTGLSEKTKNCVVENDVKGLVDLVTDEIAWQWLDNGKMVRCENENTVNNHYWWRTTINPAICYIDL